MNEILCGTKGEKVWCFGQLDRMFAICHMIRMCSI